MKLVWLALVFAVVAVIALPALDGFK